MAVSSSAIRMCLGMGAAPFRFWFGIGLGGGIDGREGEDEARAAALGAFHPDAAVLAADDLVADVQSQAKARVGVGFGDFGAVEAFEDVFGVLVGDADTVIADLGAD